jgi:hypothetical protein
MEPEDKPQTPRGERLLVALVSSLAFIVIGETFAWWALGMAEPLNWLWS